MSQEWENNTIVVLLVMTHPNLPILGHHFCLHGNWMMDAKKLKC